ncbi:MAG: glucose-6-phosphate isomerase [Kiloniellales bacterium]
MTLPYRQRIDTCMAERIGEGGLAAAELDAMLAECAHPLAALRQARDDGSMPLLALPTRRDDLEALHPVATHFASAFDHVVVLGTGGSSLGGAALYRLADGGFGPPAPTPRLHFLDNVDPATFGALFAAVDLDRTAFLVISKSGGTAETMAQLMVSLAALRRAVGNEAAGERLVAICEPGDNPLRRIAGRWGFPVIDHDPGIVGRFSVLSVVGVLPAMIAGLDPQALRDGAAAVLEAALAARRPADSAPAVGAALAVGLARHRRVAITVLMPYLDRLGGFAQWYRQLWAESLGKDGRGTTPIRAAGTVDQHSQLQLYLDGPRDKMFTLVVGRPAGAGDRVPPDLASDAALGYLAGRTMGDVLEAEQRATAETLAGHGRPVRVMRIERLDEATMGGLMMHFMLETIIAAALMGVDAFTQPAVDDSKALARQILGQTAEPRPA